MRYRKYQMELSMMKMRKMQNTKNKKYEKSSNKWGGIFSSPRVIEDVPSVLRQWTCLSFEF
jgi:hypothetical protein